MSKSNIQHVSIVPSNTAMELQSFLFGRTADFFFYESHFFLNTQKFIDFCFVSPILSIYAYIFCISGVNNVVNCLLKQNTRSG